MSPPPERMVTISASPSNRMRSGVTSANGKGGHQPSLRVLAFSCTPSTPPTFRNACSGRSSRSPLTSDSNDSTVSLTGT